VLSQTKVMEMFKAVIRRAVVELGVDALFFDGFVVAAWKPLTPAVAKPAKRISASFSECVMATIRHYANADLAIRTGRRFEPPGLYIRPALRQGWSRSRFGRNGSASAALWTARFAR